MDKKENDITVQCLKFLLAPVMRFCLRHSLRLQELIEVCKASLVEVAGEELRARGEKQTVNRISVMTGIHRADTERLLSGEAKPNPKSSSNIINRLIANWQIDKRFLTSAGKPRILTFDGKDGEFAQLLGTVSSDPNPYTVLRELERIGAIENTARGIRLCKKEYIESDDVNQSFQHLSQDSDDLITAVEENVFQVPSEPNLHLRTEYDNIGIQSLPQIRRLLLGEGSAFHSRLRKLLSHFDRDNNKKIKDRSPAVRVSVCSFARSEEISVNENSEQLKRR